MEPRGGLAEIRRRFAGRFSNPWQTERRIRVDIMLTILQSMESPKRSFGVSQVVRANDCTKCDSERRQRNGGIGRKKPRGVNIWECLRNGGCWGRQRFLGMHATVGWRWTKKDLLSITLPSKCVRSNSSSSTVTSILSAPGARY